MQPSTVTVFPCVSRRGHSDHKMDQLQQHPGEKSKRQLCNPGILLIVSALVEVPPALVVVVAWEQLR